ncbi:hypothetical protein BGZ65_004564 [Modicella reniformis]|uniref:Uncharacterized protein n=1 Tax=Modicella reniformis TaxID=1440133 RepID=A0A9P6M8W2_9FUNG|nr:hypothetical protein BGZ65_004564 [Modicella reniformis]
MALDPSAFVDQLFVYNDRYCGSINQEPASQTGLTLVATYFRSLPRSLRWMRVPAGSLSTTTEAMSKLSSTSSNTATATATITTNSTTPTATTTKNTNATITTISQTPTTTSAPTPIRTDFPPALIPPNPDPSSSDEREDRCRENSNDGCTQKTRVNRVLTVAVTIAVLGVGLMLAGSFYIYRTFRSPPESSFYDSFTVNSGRKNNSIISSGGSRNQNQSAEALADEPEDAGYNDNYQYVHDEDPNAPPTFMFNHRQDNINTNKDPKKFKENVSANTSRTMLGNPGTSSTSSQQRFKGFQQSDINLVERRA